jgi:hypothetical protein
MNMTMDQIYAARAKTAKLRISPKAIRVTAEKIFKELVGEVQ